MRAQGSPGAGGDLRWLRGNRSRGASAAGGARSRLPGSGDAAHWSELHGDREHGPRGATQRDVRTRPSDRGARRLHVAERSARGRRHGLRERVRARALDVRLRRQQGGHLRERSPPVLGAGSEHRRHPPVPRVLRQPAKVLAHRATSRAEEADRGGERRTLARRRPRRGLSHRGAPCRVRRHRRCTLPLRRRHSHQHARGDVRRRVAASRASPFRKAVASRS